VGVLDSRAVRDTSRIDDDTVRLIDQQVHISDDTARLSDGTFRLVVDRASYAREATSQKTDTFGLIDE
jgi:hypothetical protein